MKEIKCDICNKSFEGESSSLFKGELKLWWTRENRDELAEHFEDLCGSCVDKIIKKLIEIKKEVNDAR